MKKSNMKSINKQTKSMLITYAMVIAVFIIVEIMISTGMMSSLMQGLLVPLCIYSIVAIGLNLCVGYLGELSLGHAGFMCVGAFSSAFFTKCIILIDKRIKTSAAVYGKYHTKGGFYHGIQTFWKHDLSSS